MGNLDSDTEMAGLVSTCVDEDDKEEGGESKGLKVVEGLGFSKSIGFNKTGRLKCSIGLAAFGALVNPPSGCSESCRG